MSSASRLSRAATLRLLGRSGRSSPLFQRGRELQKIFGSLRQSATEQRCALHERLRLLEDERISLDTTLQRISRMRRFLEECGETFRFDSGEVLCSRLARTVQTLGRFTWQIQERTAQLAGLETDMAFLRIAVLDLDDACRALYELEAHFWRFTRAVRDQIREAGENEARSWRIHQESSR